MRRAVAVTSVGLLALGACSVGFTIGAWWQARSQADVWNDAALRATFRHAYLEGTADKRNPVFVYEVANASSHDYAVHSTSEVQLFVRHKGALSQEPGLLEIDAPFILPVGEKALLVVHYRAFERDPPGDNDSAAVSRFLVDKRHLWNQFDGMVLMDERRRYRVALPVGPWDNEGTVTAGPNN